MYIAPPVYIAPADASSGESEWRPFVEANSFGHLVAAGRGRDVPVVVPTQFVPSAWKAIGDEDPALGIPTTYYAAVQLTGTATVRDERETAGSVAEVLRTQLEAVQPEVPIADPAVAHPRQLQSILGITIAVNAVAAKFKYGGNVDEAHRRAVATRLQARQRTGDIAAADHVLRRLGAGDAER